MVTGTIVEEYASPIPIERLWRAAIRDVHNLMPMLLPEVVSSIAILEGDGGVGTIKKFNFTNAVKDISSVTDRVEMLDHKNYIFKYSVIEGGLLGVKVKSYVADITCTPTSDGGCLVKLKVEYEPLGDSLLSEEDVANIKKGNLAMVKAVDGYLLANPNAYA